MATTAVINRRQTSSMEDSSNNSDADYHDADMMIQMTLPSSPHDHDSDDGNGALVDDDDDDDDIIIPPYNSVMATNIPRVACALLASLTTGGVSYAFGLYGNALKKNLHLSQGQLETISSATFCAGLFSWIPGMFVDKFGTRAGIATGGITGATSLILYWMVAKQHFVFTKELAVIVLSSLSMCIFLSCALVTGAVFKIISCSCEAGTKGKAVGVAKGLVGLGSGLYACLFQAIRGPTTSDLDILPMCALFFLVAATIPSVLVLPNKLDERKKPPDALTPLHFQLLFGSLLVLAVIIVGNSVLELFHNREDPGNSKTASNYPLAGLILLVWWSPLAAQVYLPKREIAMAEHSEEEQHALLDNEQDDDDDQTPTTHNKGIKHDRSGDSELGDNNDAVGDNDDVLRDPSNIAQEPTVPASVVHKNLYQMLQTYPAWLMLWTATILVGGGTVETNNLGQMVESLHFPPVVTSASLSLFSVAQSGGRVAVGALSDWALTWETRKCFVDRGVPRPFFLVVASVAGVIAHTILAISTDEVSFVIGIAFSGLAFGSVWPLLVLITGEIYGTAHVGANYMFYDGFTSAAGTFLLSKVVAQQVYDSHLDPHYSDADDGTTCYGQECFQMTHVIIAVLSLICIGTSVAFQYSTRERYNS